MTRCLNCTSLRLRGAPLARNGFGGCKHLPAFMSVAVLYERKCDLYRAADDDVSTKRAEWARKTLGVA